MTESPLIRVLGEVMVDVLARTSTAPAPGSDAPASISDEEGGSGANVAAWLAPGDLLLANADEASALTGHSNPLDALRALTDRDLLVVVKRGADGAVVGSGDQRWSAPAMPAENRDSTGAGDAFAAGFLASWTREADIEEALRLATRVAARAVSLQGGRP